MVCSNLTSNKSTSAIFPVAFAHFMPVSHFSNTFHTENVLIIVFVRKTHSEIIYTHQKYTTKAIYINVLTICHPKEIPSAVIKWEWKRNWLNMLKFYWGLNIWLNKMFSPLWFKIFYLLYIFGCSGPSFCTQTFLVVASGQYSLVAVHVVLVESSCCGALTLGAEASLVGAHGS